MTTITKKQNSFVLSQHSLERLQERFPSLTQAQVQDSFQRSKTLDSQNAAKFGKKFYNRVLQKSIHEPNQKFFANPYYDITFVVDFDTNTIVTVYSITKY